MIVQSDIKINVVGVGGGGCSIVSRIATLLDQGGSSSLISLTAVNTDAQALEKCKNIKSDIYKKHCKPII